MYTFDKVIIIHLIIEGVFAIIFLLWQFDLLSCSGKAIQIIINILNVFETIILVLTLFLEYGTWGTFGLGAWYVLNTILLILQFSLSDWGPRHKILDVLWILFYVYLFFSDVLHIDLINSFAERYNESILAFGESIKDTYWGDVLKSIIIVIVKFVLKLIVSIKEE